MARRKAKIRIKNPPIEPKRKKVKVSFSLDRAGTTLGEIARYFTDKGVHPDDVKLSGATSRYYRSGGSNRSFYVTQWEPEEQFQVRMNRYVDRMHKYNDWKEKNKELIEEELRLREEEERQKKEKIELKKLKRLQREQEQHEKKLASIQKQLEKVKGSRK
jgi:hypothetical protein